MSETPSGATPTEAVDESEQPPKKRFVVSNPDLEDSEIPVSSVRHDDEHGWGAKEEE